MRFDGYWVDLQSDRATIKRASFDETELDPATQWKEAWQNSDASVTSRGFVDSERAVMCAAHHVARLQGLLPDSINLSSLKLSSLNWTEGVCEVFTLTDLAN